MVIPKAVTYQPEGKNMGENGKDKDLSWHVWSAAVKVTCSVTSDFEVS